MNIGYAQSDITPHQPGLTLSGFASRQEQPSTAIDDPLHVQAIAIDHWILISFDLLAIGQPLHDQLNTAFDAAGLPPRVYSCTHTHSAPATITLIRCGTIDPDYTQHILRTALATAQAAIAAQRPATLTTATAHLAGLSTNRRHLLDTGRIAMYPAPTDTVVAQGPTIDTATLIRATATHDQSPIVTLLHWACHPIACDSLHITADFPGQLKHRLAPTLGPTIYLQGACADINPPALGRPAMLDHVDQLLPRLQDLTWQPAPATTLTPRPAPLQLHYDLPQTRTCTLHLQTARLGPYDLAFVPAEPFASTALDLQATSPRPTLLIGYTSPLVGYLPTDQAMRQGGYEAAEAYTWFNHPAPWKPNTEPTLRQHLIAALGTR